MGGQYGPLTGLVGVVGSLVAAGAAIALTWRGRSRWEPSETDIPNGPQRVGGLVTTVLIAILWALTRGSTSAGVLAGLALGLLVALVASLLGYGYVTATQTYDGAQAGHKIIGGFRLIPAAKSALREHRSTTQQLFASVAYDPDRVWPRRSRASAKLVFTVLYLVLVVSGSLALAAAAILVEKQAAGGAPTASPSPTQATAPTVSARTLRWTDSPTSGAVLDGGVLLPGKDVWLQELFPAAPPTAFQVNEVVDASWPAAVRDAVASLHPPLFAPTVSGFRAVSDSAWRLPEALAGIGYRTFSFADTNPENAPASSGTIIVGRAAISPGSGGAACAAPGPSGGLTGTAGTSTCLQFDVNAARDPTFDVNLLVPWGDGRTSLSAAVMTWFRDLAATVARSGSGAAFDADAAFGAFSEQNAASLPGSAPPGWSIGLDTDAVTVAPTEPGHLALTVTAPSMGSVLVALELTDRADGSTVMSPLIPISITGNGLPTVAIVEPANDLVGSNRLAYTGSDANGWFTDLKVAATGSDPEDGVLGGEAFAWSTDRVDLQAPDLGRGDSLGIRLYSNNCEGGAVHTVTVTVTDSAGQSASTSRLIEIGQVC